MVKLIPGLRRVGSTVTAEFRPRVKLHPEALEVADNFGQKNFEGPSQRLVVKWQRPYSLEDDIWKRWMLEAGDSGKSSGPWARQGVPVGEEVPIEARGSPPKRGEERGDQAAPDVQEAFMSGYKNEGSKKEGEHYLAAGYGIKVEWNKALKEDPHGTIAKPTSVGKRTPRTPAVLHGALR